VLKSFHIDDARERYGALRDARDAAIAQVRSGPQDESDEVVFTVEPEIDLEYADGRGGWFEDDADESANASFTTPHLR
jgi:hypothetical protein